MAWDLSYDVHLLSCFVHYGIDLAFVVFLNGQAMSSAFIITSYMY
uniref:Uncharacterized protein n=1 Tax=Lepeophtheirus salmonis TaxID=72036 RepID=A0A0K2TCT9_LEPSM